MALFSLPTTLPATVTPAAPTVAGGFNGAPIIRINGAIVTVVTLPSFSDVIAQRGSVALTVIDHSGALTIRDGHSVSVTDQAGVPIFTGFVASAVLQRISYQPALYGWAVTCVDATSLCDRKVYAQTYTNVTCGHIVRDMLTNALAVEGISALTIADGPTLTAYQINYEPVSKHLDALAQMAGFYWTLDAQLRLTFAPYTTTAAPFTFTGAEALAMDRNARVTLEYTSPLYRNGQYVLGITELTTTQTETRIGDGTTTAFTMSYALHSTPTVKVNGVTQTVGILGVDTGKQWYWNQSKQTITQDSSGTKLVSTDTLTVTYVGEYPSLVYAEDGEQVALQKSLEGNTTSGVVQAVVTDTTIVTSNQGFTVAQGYLGKYATGGKILTFTTLHGGLASGQLLDVNMPAAPWNLTAQQFLIESVSWAFDGFRWWATVTALSGPVDDTWVKFFQRLAAGQNVINTSNTGVSQTVALLQSGAVSLSWTVTGNATVNSLLIPSSTLYPSTTLYPGTAGAPVSIAWTKTNAGLNALRDVLNGNQSGGLAVTWFAWGTGTQGTPAGATQLAAEVGRKAITSVVAGASVGEDIITGYLGPTDANGIAITEVAFFAGPSASATANSGVMLLYGLYSDTKSNTQSIKIVADSTIS